MNTFLLTPRRIPVERKASAAKREVDQDMVAREESVSEVGSDAESGWSGVSDNSSTDSECTDIEASSIASDQDRFDTVYEAFQDLANDLYYIDLRRYSRGITSGCGWGPKPIHRASIHPIHFDEFFFSSSYGQISRKHIFVDVFCLEHDLDAL